MKFLFIYLFILQDLKKGSGVLSLIQNQFLIKDNHLFIQRQQCASITQPS